MERITTRHKRFVEQYCAHFNGARAAREAGYAESRDRQTATELLADPDISRMVEERLEELAMGAAEATKRLADIARSEIGDFFRIIEDDDGHRIMVLDREAVIEQGGGLIQELNWGRHGPKLKLYDAKDALKTILDAHGAFNHEKKVNLGGGVQVIFEEKDE